jgi:hypothetical protein
MKRRPEVRLKMTTTIKPDFGVAFNLEPFKHRVFTPLSKVLSLFA